MIIGSISGVRPTATAMAKKNAPLQSPFVSPLITNTIGRDHVAGSQGHHVTGHEAGDRDLHRPAAAKNGGIDRNHRLELRRGAIGLGLLEELQAGSHDDHEDHHRPGPKITRGERDPGESGQQDHQRIDEGMTEKCDQPGPLVLGQRIRAVLGKSLQGLVLRKPFEPRPVGYEEGGNVHGGRRRHGPAVG